MIHIYHCLTNWWSSMIIINQWWWINGFRAILRSQIAVSPKVDSSRSFSRKWHDENSSLPAEVNFTPPFFPQEKFDADDFAQKLMCHLLVDTEHGGWSSTILGATEYDIWDLMVFPMVFPWFSGWGFECMRVFIFSWKCLLSPWVQRVKIHDKNQSPNGESTLTQQSSPPKSLWMGVIYKVVNHPPMVGFLLALPH